MAAIRVHHVDFSVAITIGNESNRGAVRGPGRHTVVEEIIGQIGHTTAIRTLKGIFDVEHVDVAGRVVCVAMGFESNPGAIRGPSQRVNAGGDASQSGQLAAIRVHHVDYSQLGSGPSRKSDPGAIWRPNRIFASDVTIRELSQVAAIRVDDVDGSDGTLTGGDLIADKNNLGAIRGPGRATIPRVVIG